MTRINISECTCPACGIKLDIPPSRKKKCPSCKQFMYVRTAPVDRNQYLVTEDEIAKIEQEWVQHYENQANQPQHTEEEYEQLFNMPLNISLIRKKRQSLIGKLSGKGPVPVRWVLGPWCKAHCRRIAGYPSCYDVAGEYEEIGCLPTLPYGDKLACTSDEFNEWWNDHHDEDNENMECDCHLELSFDGGKTFIRPTE